MREVLELGAVSSDGGFSGVVSAGAGDDELPVSSPMTPKTAPAPATTNPTVDSVAIDLAELMSPFSAELHVMLPPMFAQFGELLMLFVFDIDSTPVMLPTITPAPARPKPPNIRPFEKPDLPLGAGSSGVVVSVGAGVVSAGPEGAAPGTTSMVRSLWSFSARSISCFDSGRRPWPRSRGDRG